MESGFFNDLINDVADKNMTGTEAFMLTSQLFAEADDMIEDYGMTEVRKIKKNCAEVWKMLLPVCGGELEKKAFEMFSGWVREGVLHGIEEVEKIWMKYFDEEEFYQRKLQIVDEKTGSCDDEKKLELWIERRIELMQKCGFASEDAEAFEKKYWSRPSVRRYAISRLIDSGNSEAAFELLKECRASDADDCDQVEWYCRQIVKISRMMGDEAYKKELYDVITVYLPCDILSFRFLKRSCSPEEWRKMRSGIFQSIGHMPGAAELYAEEGMFNGLIEYLKKQGTLEEMIRYEEKLGQRYAVDILNVYEEIFDEMINNASKRCHYRNVVKHMNRMKKYPGGENRMYDLINRWREKYSRKNALLMELAKL